MSLDAAFLRALQAIAAVRADEPLSRHTTIGVGGPTDAYVVVNTTDELAAVVRLCREAGVPFFVLGSGSNIVVGDRGIRGVVIDNKANEITAPAPMPRVSTVGTDSDIDAPPRFLVRADSGCSFAATARQLSFAGFEGLAWASGIPGSIGGAVVYNAGAYGGCLGDVLQRIAVADEEGVREIEAAELGLVYRGSDFTRGVMAGGAVVWAEFALWQGDETELRARVADYDERRIKAQPRGRNAGSFFKNPTAQPAWRLIDSVGLRGHQIGGAQFSAKHCNFLINAGDATAADVAALKNLAQTRVREQHGVALEQEVSFVGEGFGEDAA